jgi:hypothetical protein
MTTNAIQGHIASLCTVLLLSASLAAPGDVLKGRALDGCYRLYKGPALPSGQVTILTTDPESPMKPGYSPLKLIGIDKVTGPHKEQGYGNFDGGGVNVEIPPGPHVLVFSYHHVQSGKFLTETASGEPQMVLFAAKPGRLYQAKAEVEGSRWSPKIVEVGTIPEKYERPAKSCEQFPTNVSGCLERTALESK